MDSVAMVNTPQAARYLTQLCKHFEHKLPVTHGDGKGRIPFSTGDCLLSAKEGVLTLTVNAPDEAGLAQLEDVVERHLVRFAFPRGHGVDVESGRRGRRQNIKVFLLLFLQKKKLLLF